MAIRKTKPTSPGRRFATYQHREELTGDKPHKALTKGKNQSGGRNSRGRVTARHRGGGAKRRYREIDFKRRKDGVAGEGRDDRVRPEPHLLHRAPALRRRREELHPRARRACGPATRWSPARRPTSGPATRCRCSSIPTGTVVHNVELVPGQGGKLGRAAGSAIQVVAKEGQMVTLRLPSSEMRMVRADCRATVGTLSNAEHQNVKVGKAGRNRHKGKRPQTRGIAMNPVDHPHGGGEAHKTPGGHPVTPWGKPTLGYRTRKKGKRSDAMIVRGRRRGKKTRQR